MRDFLAVAEQIVRDEPGLADCLPVIEKELLHVEILRAMHQAGHLRHLTFKGGTCLRLCHGGLRFSEDLDFSGGSTFDDALLRDIEHVLRARIGERYGLEVTVAPPKLAEGRTRSVRRWVARIITRPAGSGSSLRGAGPSRSPAEGVFLRGASPSRSPAEGSRLGVQRIKLEIDDREAPPDIAAVPVRQRHALLADDFVPFPIQAASMADICSDKMVAYPMSVLTREHPRHRDAWDIAWLTERPGTNAADLAKRAADKVEARGLRRRMREALRLTVERSEELIESDGFRATLLRFVPREVAVVTVADPEYRLRLAAMLRATCASVLDALANHDGDQTPTP